MQLYYEDSFTSVSIYTCAYETHIEIITTTLRGHALGRDAVVLGAVDSVAH